ncbi:MAG: shikimate dehydrogenase [candidate division WS1 bacterium]|jgi:predicted amino acid dehydrogenase|nr:shikimate dehydrogenase [candidate division WS1 bacterium]
MHRFAFIVHPLSVSDYYRKYAWMRMLPPSWMESLVARVRPNQVVSEITGVVSATGEETQGWFIGCPLTARRLIHGDEKKNLENIIGCAKLAQDIGADIVGLGAFTSIVGDAGISIAEAVDIGVTTGNSYTVATAMEGALEAARQVGINLAEAKVTILGATGSIGQVCARLLAPSVGALSLCARRREALEALADEIAPYGALVQVTTEVNKALGEADIVIAVTSAVEAVVQPEMLKPGAVVCDVARPRDVSRQVADKRQDVLVIEGGAVAVPGNVQFNFNFGFPPRTAYACMAETMILALAGKTADYSLGREIRLGQVREITELAKVHGFKLAGFRSFERAVTAEQIERVRIAGGRVAAPIRGAVPDG